MCRGRCLRLCLLVWREGVLEVDGNGPKRLLVTGSRDWDDKHAMEMALFNAYSRFAGGVTGGQVTLIHGDARGADKMAGHIWLKHKAGPLEIVRADWHRYGKRAGYMRNAEMVKRGADLCVAFIKNSSRGATMCADLAEEAGIEVIRITATGQPNQTPPINRVGL